MIESHRLQRCRVRSWQPAGDRGGFFTDGAREGSRERMRQELANPDHIPVDERCAERVEEGEHDASSIVSNSHFATNDTCDQAKQAVTAHTIVHRYKAMSSRVCHAAVAGMRTLEMPFGSSITAGRGAHRVERSSACAAQ